MMQSVRAGRILDLPSSDTLSDGTAGKSAATHLISENVANGRRLMCSAPHHKMMAAARPSRVRLSSIEGKVLWDQDACVQVRSLGCSADACCAGCVQGA